MARIVVDVTFANCLDEMDARQGRLADDAVRRVQFPEVLAGRPASHILLPAGAIQSLGLQFNRRVEVSTASGPIATKLFDGVTVKILGRSVPFSCVEMPDEIMPAIGWIVLGALGIELDPQTQQLAPLAEPYLRI
jgi:hypothetical protein